MNRHIRFSNGAAQQGAVLIVSLLILLMMTVIGVTAMQTNFMEEKMAGNFRDVNLAFQAAEAALRDAEDDISSTPPRFTGLTGFNSTCSNALCNASGGLSDVWNDATKGPNGAALGTYTSTGSLALVSCQPVYWIEGFRTRPAGSASWKTWYRVTTRSCGGSNNSRVMLQSVYAP